MISKSTRTLLWFLVTAIMFAVTPAWADPVNWDHAFALQTNGGIVNPGVLVGFNPQPDPPGRIADLLECPALGIAGAPPDPCLVLHNQHFEEPPFPMFDVFMTMSLPGMRLLFRPDALPTDDFSTFHIEVVGQPNVVGDVSPARKLFDVFLDFSSTSGGIVDASSAVSFNPQPDPPGVFTPNGWGMHFAYTGNSDATVAIRIYDADGTKLTATPVPEPSSLILLGATFGALGLAKFGRRRN